MMIYRKLSLFEKIKLLLIILLRRWGILHLSIVYKRIQLNEYSRELLNESSWIYVDGLFGYKLHYKKMIDPTGQFRFYIPSLDKDAVYRIDTRYTVKDELLLPEPLLMVYGKEGRELDDLS